VEAVAIISVVSSSGVAAAAIWSGIWRQGRSFRHERELADRAAGRELLARTVAVLHRAEYAIDDAVAALTRYGAGMFDDDHEDRAAPYFKVEEVGRELDQVRGEVAIFMGPKHQATEALEQVGANFLDAYRAMGMIRLEGSADPGTAAAREAADFVGSQRRRASDARDGFKLSQAHFIRAAHAAVGAVLPGGED
jgi:hypothetical protein